MMDGAKRLVNTVVRGSLELAVTSSKRGKIASAAKLGF